MYWNTGNLTTKQNIVKGGEYWVVGQNICGRDTAKILIAQKYTPSPALGPDTVICKGDRIELKTHVPEHILNESFVLWNDKVESSELYVERKNRYIVMVKNQCGEGRDTVEVEVRNLPELKGLKDTVVCDNTLEYDFTELPYSLLWQDGTEENRYRITMPGEYSIEIWDELGCYSSERFKVTECPSEIWIPNAFTPNSDGRNEQFKIWKDGIYDYEMRIYDRWNKLVYEGFDVREGWNGSVNNEPDRECAQGMYIYKIQFREQDNKQLQIIVGEVNLLR
jgi:gliding motility-associated-like protein